MRPRALCLAVAVVLSGCGPTRYRGFCDLSASAICRAVFRCNVDAARMHWPNIQDCTTTLRTTGDCGRPEFDDCTLPMDKTSQCLDDLDNLTCAATFVVPTSCDLTCANPSM